MSAPRATARPGRRHGASAVLGCAMLASSVVAPPASADTANGESVRETVLTYRIDARLRTSPTVPFEAMRLGHVVIPARLVLHNRNGVTVPVGDRALKFVARGTLAAYPCEPRSPKGDRLPAALDPGETAEAECSVACETTLPGNHVLEARWASSDDDDAPLASAPFEIEGGPSSPVPLSTRPGLHAIVAGTRDVAPSNDPGKVRLVLGLTNATPNAVALPTVAVTTSLHMRGSKLACGERRVVELTGQLPPGRQHVVWMPLSCALPTEGTWEVDVDVGEPGAPTVRLPRHVVRVLVKQPPLPRGADQLPVTPR